MTTRRVLVLFGGRSGEHEVSVASACSVVAALEEAGFDYRTVGIARDGRWVEADPRQAPDVAGDGPAFEMAALFSPTRDFDVVFPVLHGPFGEDGTIQGALELAGVAFVGAGVEGSVLGTNKVLHKRLFAAAGLPVVEFTDLTPREWGSAPGDVADRVAKLGLPCFVKPARLGSSVGISKVDDPADLPAAVERALRHDDLVVVEAKGGPIELEVGVIEGAGGPETSVVGQIDPAGDFYDYESKYGDAGTGLLVPAPIDPAVAGRVRDLAVTVFRTSLCEGLARVDFFYDPSTGEVLVNEINSIPGLTSSSMFPRVWEASGLRLPAVVERLIDHALARHARRAELEAARAASHAGEVRKGGLSDR